MHNMDKDGDKKEDHPIDKILIKILIIILNPKKYLLRLRTL